MTWALVAGGLGALAIVLYASGQPEPRVVAAVAGLVAGSAVLVGTLLGVLFAAAHPGRPMEGSSTHFEQISGWLTTILVGLGLTQLGRFGEHLESLGARLAPSLGGGPAGEVVGGALALYFALAGFLVAYAGAAHERSLPHADSRMGHDEDSRQPAPPAPDATSAGIPATVLPGVAEGPRADAEGPGPSRDDLGHRIGTKSELIDRMRAAGVEGNELAKVYAERAELRVAESRHLRESGDVEAAAEEAATAQGDVMQAELLAPGLSETLRREPWFETLYTWRSQAS